MDNVTAVKPHVVVVGPVFPYRAGIAYCTTRLADELAKSCDVSILSFRRQYPKRFYPGGDDVDETLRERTPEDAEFLLDIVQPWTWFRAAMRLRREAPDAVILVWWIWIWALPYRVLTTFLPRSTQVIVQAHNVTDKEPAAWKRLLANVLLRRGDVLVVHAETERDEALRRLPRARVISTFLPVHELGQSIPTRDEAKAQLNLVGQKVALFFGHIRPFKGLDLALEAWRRVSPDVFLLAAGEAWWKGGQHYRALAEGLPNARMEFRYIPDSEVATYFAAADVVLAPYRTEAQSGVALTAFHFGRPVIATRVGGLPEVIEDGVNGLLVPPEDPVALAIAVNHFFTDCDRAAMEAGATATARLCSWEDYGALFSRLVHRT